MAKHTTRVLAVFAALAAGCTEGTPESCGVDMDASYLAHFTPRSGDCPPLDDQFISFLSERSPTCSVTVDVDDRCHVTRRAICRGEGYTSDSTATVMPQGDDYAGTAEVGMLNTGSGHSCHSLYTLRLTRQ